MADGQYNQQENSGEPQYDQQDASQQAAGQGSVAARKKRDRYAGQAYDFGTGANVAQGNQPPAAAYGGQPAPPYGQQQQPAYAQPSYGQPAYGDQASQTAATQPAYGQPAYGGQPGYPGPDQYGAQGGVGAVTQQFGQMGIQQQPAAPQAASTNAPLQLNRLQTTDLISQPFHVSELDLPPPPIILPPNVCLLITFDFLVGANKLR